MDRTYIVIINNYRRYPFSDFWEANDFMIYWDGLIDVE